MNRKRILFSLAMIFLVVRAQAQSSTDDALEIFSRLTGRTVLRPGLLPRLEDWNAEQLPTGSNAAVRFIEEAFAKTKVELLPDGDRFVRVLPAGWRETPLAAALAFIKSPPAREDSLSETNLQPVAMPDYRALPLDQWLDIYSELSSRTILRPAFLPNVAIHSRHLIPQRRLTKEEAVYVLSVTLVMNGVAVVEDGEKFVQVVQLPRLPRVQAKAPKPESGARTGDPEKLPKFRPGFSDDVSRPNVGNLISFHSGLTGRSTEAAAPIGALPVYFVMSNPLTAAELTYAVETTLALNGLKIVPGDGDNFRVERVAERPAEK
jgi:hypothetical protein